MHPEVLRIIAEERDPLRFCKVFWPRTSFSLKQEEVIYSVEENKETIAVSCHKSGKDFVTGFICTRQFLINPVVRIVTTSVADDHLKVLWGEMENFIQTSRFPLIHKRGGSLVCNHREIRKVRSGELDRISYMIGMVAERPEKMAGHHAPYTLFVVDEASGVKQEVYDKAITWAKRILIIGNPYNCNNFFNRGVELGDLKAEAA